MASTDKKKIRAAVHDGSLGRRNGIGPGSEVPVKDGFIHEPVLDC